MICFLMLVFAICGLCVVGRVIGIKGCMALLWLGLAVFVLMVAWAIYDRYGGLGGVLAALVFLVVVGVCALNEWSKHQ
jgi:hypothetical protein